MTLIGARHPSALVNMAWFLPNWAAFLVGSMLSSKAMASPRRLLFMPTWSMAIPFFHTSWWFNNPVGRVAQKVIWFLLL